MLTKFCRLGFSFVDKIWAGEAHAIQDPWYARYGPGLPIMGIYRTQWLEGQHGEKVQNVYDPTQPAPAFTQENALKPPSVYDDIYPVPTSWVHSVFQKATWDVSVKRTGTQSHMGPLTMGMRLLQTEPGKRADYFSWISAVDKELELTYALSIDPQANKIPPADYQRLVDATRIYLKMGILAEKRGELRSDKAFTSWPRQFGTDQITAHPFDPLPDDEEIPTETYSSPRYDEIVNYLCRNRGPLELALDTMGTLPTSVFYRYIRDRGGIDVLPMELWQFLGVANRKGEYFIFDPYPGPGLVTRIEAGWPPGNVLANMTIPRPAFLATRLEKDRLMEIVRDRNVQDELYTNNVHMRTMRDMDVDAFGRFLEARKDKSWIGKYVPAEFYAIVTQCVRETWDFNDEFTLGPQGIIRFTYDVRPTLTRNGSDYQKAKFAELQQRVDEANRKWRNRV
ncbi:uncharacterized protein LY89DRAFT_780339 [Mollisia scopiformis]|uniref:Uncharacterized protein n=1 Tax=Mollisia scopiformis TaxID=149040 RepID=A0A194XHZ7_MOLSC|nr:uncharacterized protein LY89DRAFT_780339 [Mollisia scopiformis]KUJ19392.1 hypothetical protein LY89DRAFT_780339 [Mollisia scopiformis]